MYSEQFIHSLSEDRNLAASQMRLYFLEEDKRYKGLPMNKDVHNSYVRGMFQFKAYCDPYELEYSLPQLGENVQDNIDAIRQFFVNVKVVPVKEIEA